MKKITAIITLAVAGIVLAGCAKEPTGEPSGKPSGKPSGEETKQFTDLSSTGTANCYIVSETGNYKFNATVKGNSTETVEAPASAEILWESFGTAEAPSAGDLVKNVTLKDGYVMFEASSRKGNAVIAVKNSSGKILWSWHIWLTDQPQSQVYNNTVIKMMDRNLGAVSVTSHNDGTCGLLYQWGRKDPFLGGNGSSGTATATLSSWPTTSSDSNGTIEYSVENPTTFITNNTSNHDWYYTGDSSTDNDRWKPSKTMYDPCPSGWYVPNGGWSGIWTTAFAQMVSWTKPANWDSTNRGMDFGSTELKLGKGTIWYPAAGCRDSGDGTLNSIRDGGFYWSCTVDGESAYCLYFNYSGLVDPRNSTYRAYGQSVRCALENK